MLECDAHCGGIAYPKLPLKPHHPVLLPLTGNALFPAVVYDLGPKALDNDCKRGLKTPPVGFGSQGVHSMARDTAVTFQP